MQYLAYLKRLKTHKMLPCTLNSCTYHYNIKFPINNNKTNFYLHEI